MSHDDSNSNSDTDIDAVTLEIMRNQFEGVAEEMGQVLITSSYSPNIKERRDCSTALFDAEGRLVAQAEHIPVHLGAMPEAVDTVLDYDPEPGDVFVLNDPFEGGTHLPDVTMVSPVTVGDEILGYAVSRAHHADVGGMTPGSMPAGAREIYQEGIRLPPVRLVKRGEVNDDVMSLLLANVRNPGERRADIRAQIAANERAEERLGDLVEEHGRERVVSAFDAVISYSRDRLLAELADLPNGTYSAHDVMEGDGISDDEIPIEVSVTVDDEEIEVDFSGTAPQVPGNVNAPLAVAKSAVYFVIRCVTDPEIPPNEGCYDPVSVSVPDGSLLNPRPPAAVVGGNVETSQRVTDVMFSALAEAAPVRVPAQGQGTMNNLTIGSRNGGDDGFTYYETIAGGFGGRPTKDGMDGVQVGMTNTLNTPVESLEAEYPLFVERYGLRENSGGHGQFRGGLGVVRSVSVETDATVSLLTERRRVAPHGIDGGEDGRCGRNEIDGERVPAKATRDVESGTTITVFTPGGGGHGPAEERDPGAIEMDRDDGKMEWEE
ncbi:MULTISPECIES: hydantoinase B/oxoprolinase family protein [unclassified Haladaptatus]|uniref:hydantoinase B/oxoprolinase family protein n=1 Tax=unclassified Haladaptatus TaxID=2622732 RepID=UPI00209BEC9B|nr:MULTISPECIES: hydantoinase B/oxoprolinase family protein [unclassified Haladaptatus]MCO8245857.1 hydantoinase B/oxoprolinase family protein [Haladaptatus sp. AB643]MCO8256204.1 hydantoinase B/oxoprolinase family protein [Haladaptatus sp. AB618]